jgi:adenylate cyclase
MTLSDASTTQVTRTFAFVDLCGFTDHLDHHGNDVAMSELRLLRSTVRDVAPLCAVRIEKWLGDGVMLVSVDAEPMITAVLAITQRLGVSGRLPVRAGIATGEVLLLEGDDYIGRTVNLASRLCDRAGEGEVLVAGDDLELPDGVRAERARLLRVRGMRQPVAVRSVMIDDQGPTASVSCSRRPGGLAGLLDQMFRPVR